MKINRDTKLPQIRFEVVILCLAILIQIYLVARSFVLPSIGLIRDTHNLTAQDRSAVIAFGDRYAEYFAWIRENTPENAVLLIPPADLDEILGHFGVMQFYFIPRRISDCPREQPWGDCIRMQRGRDTFILADKDFPPIKDLERTYSFLRFDEDWGLYLPNP
ncbi:MAG: hypothetical protein P8Z41_12230 [Anaerolineales bacterium]|jgi:hypothetical protein